MRLSEISELILKNKEGIIRVIENAKDVTINGITYKRLTNLDQFRQSVNKLDEAALFPNLIRFIKELPSFSMTPNTLDFSPADFIKFERLARQLFDLVSELAFTINETLPEQNEEFINIKLPPSANNFSSLSKFFRDLDKAFAPILDIGGSATVEGFEPGSKWINIVVGASLAISTSASLAWSGAVIAKKIQEFRMQDEAIRSMGLKNDFISALKEGQEKQMKLFIDAETGAICKATGKEYTTEEINRIKLSIETFGELIIKGTEVHPSLTAPEEVRNLFPKDIPFNLIESKTKKLEQNNLRENGQE